ncbi:MAG: alpha/beta hydrolase [Akkermansiaceae bacterium]|nr:alpha/beta hydrolase [Akkermansiaceae bacterium]
MSHILPKAPVIGESRDRRLLERASSYIYSRTPHGDLTAHVFEPEAPAAGPRPVVVFFHGGLWDAFMPTQFAPQCHHLTTRGAVAAIVETRVSSKHGTSPVEAVEDAREAIRWLRLQAAVLQIDPIRVTAAGAAGGATLALLTAMPTDKALPPVDGVSCRPQALALFSAVVNTRGTAEVAGRFPDKRSAKALNPSSLVRSKLPPMILFHGKADPIAPFDEVKRFRRRLRWRRNVCELAAFDQAGHSFFNFNVNHEYFEVTTAALCRFLTAHGLLDPAEPG